MDTSDKIITPLAVAPWAMKRHGYADAHTYPLVSPLGKPDQPTLPFICFRTEPERAWGNQQVEFNPANSTACLCFDVDNPNAHELIADLSIYQRTIPIPNWITVRKATGHAHVTFTLGPPVHRNTHSSPKPLHKLGVASEYLAYTLGADPAYSGTLTHNPVSRRRGFKTVWMQKQPYTLGALVEFVPDAFSVPAQPITAIGRNCDLHRAGCRWKYRNQSEDVLPWLLIRNQAFDLPLSEQEVGWIAKSIERWAAKCDSGEWGVVKVAGVPQRKRLHWYTPDEASEYGRRRGIKSGKARRAKVQERDETIRYMAHHGMSQREIAKHFGLSQNAVGNVLRRSEP